MRGRTLIVILTGVIICSDLVFFAKGPSYKWKLSAFHKEWMRIGSTDELRAWPLDLIEFRDKTEDFYYNRYSKNQPEMPGFLSKHSDGLPSYITIIRDDNPSLDRVIVTWGGGLGHW